MPIEFTESVINSLENLMLAQAQEAVWQRAMLGKNETRYIILTPLDDSL